MNLFWQLIRIDTLGFRDWFRKQTFSRIIVAFAYILVLAGVGVGVFYWSDAFFKYVAPYETFGQITDIYILRGAYLLLFWVGVLSSLITTLTFLLSPDRQEDLLLTFPIPPLTLSLRATLKSATVNLFLFLISIFPLVLAFTHNIWTSSFSVLVLVLLTDTFGTSLGYFLSFLFHKKYGRLIFISIGFLLLIVTWLVLRIIFPPGLKVLSDLPAESFAPFFNSLPLIKNCWLSGELVGLAIGDFSGLPTMLILLFVLILVTGLVQHHLFIPIWQSQKLQSSTSITTKSKMGNFRNLNLITKDLLSFIRNPKDLGYLVFLLSMILAFFGLFGRSYLARGIPERFQVDALAFSFAWLIFFSGTYLIRLTYPLMVNEGQSKWWFFTLPVFSYRLLLYKVSTSLLLSLPLLILAFLEWRLLPFVLFPYFFGLLSLVAIISLAVIFPLIGTIYPDFSQAYHPDRASTSLTGLLSIIIAVLFGFLGSWLASGSLRNYFGQELALNAYLTLGILISAFTWIAAKSYLDHYSIDV